MKPVIGITTAYNPEQDHYFLRNRYVGGVRQAGGLPLLLPYLPDDESLVICARRLDGLLLTGGGDIHPFLFGEEPNRKLGAFDPERDAFEIAIMKTMLNLRKPVLGICRGIQVINVALGGTLYQDLETQLPGSLQHQQQAARRHPAHGVTVQPESRLAGILGSARLRVNSLHHQAIRDPAPGLRVTAWADDGVIEGVEAPGDPLLLGVQWHPEDLWRHDPAAASLFRALVQAAGG
jgi:putative glutamine amidotransferase